MSELEGAIGCNIEIPLITQEKEYVTFDDKARQEWATYLILGKLGNLD